jgi:hypothetical protein
MTSSNIFIFETYFHHLLLSFFRAQRSQLYTGENNVWISLEGKGVLRGVARLGSPSLEGDPKPAHAQELLHERLLFRTLQLQHAVVLGTRL